MADVGAAAAINSAKVSPFANLSNLMLADAMGEIAQELKALEARQNAARDEMVRRKLSAIEGSRFIVVKAVTDASRFDSKAVRKEMGDDWYEARQKSGTRTTFVVTEKRDEPSESDVRAAAEALFRR